MTLWPLALYALFAVLVAAGMLVLSHLLGERGGTRTSAPPFESGMVPTGDARGQLPVQFYLVAMFFVIFDIEVVFLLTWAVAARDLGATGFAGAAIFIGILLIALYYEHREGALDWGTSAKLAGRPRTSSLRTPQSQESAR